MLNYSSAPSLSSDIISPSSIVLNVATYTDKKGVFPPILPISYYYSCKIKAIKLQRLFDL
jgi:hypothetical protein